MALLYNIKKRISIKRAIKDLGSIYNFESFQNVYFASEKRLDEMSEYFAKSGNLSYTNYDTSAAFDDMLYSTQVTQLFDDAIIEKEVISGGSCKTQIIRVKLKNGEFAQFTFDNGKVKDVVVKDNYGVYCKVVSSDLPLKKCTITLQKLVELGNRVTNKELEK